MKAIILAAGRGSRMKNLTDARPKCLVELGGKSLLDWQLKALREAGIRDIAIVTGYQRQQLSKFGLVEFYNHRWATTNMVSSLTCAQEWLLAEPCIVSYSDIFYEASGIKSLMKSKAGLAITYDPNWLKIWKNRFANPMLDAETFRLNSDKTLLEIGNSPKSLQEIQGQFMGLLLFTVEGWSEIMRIRSKMPLIQCNQIHMTGTLQKVLEEGRIPIEAIPYEGIWGEIDTEKDWRVYQKQFRLRVRN